MSQETIEKDDIRGDLAAAIETVETNAPGSTGRFAGVAKQEKPSGDADPLAAKEESPKQPSSKPDGERDASGKFKPVKDKSGVEKSPDETNKQASPAQPGAEAKADAVPGGIPPNVKAEWDKLPPDVRQFIAKRENDLATQAGKHGNELNQVKTKFDELEQHIGPRRAALVANFGSAGAAVKRLLDLSDYASTDPSGFIAYLAQQNGIDLKALAGLKADEAAANPSAAIHQEFLQRFNGLESKLQTFEQSQQQQRHNANAAEIAAVANETDDQGNKLRPFFDELRTQLGSYISAVRQENPAWTPRQVTEEAYDRAAWATKGVRERLLASNSDARSQDEGAKARAEAAERARKSQIGDPPNRFNAPSGGSKGSVRDDISQAVYASMGGSARL